MRDKINQAFRGEFEYSRAKLIISKKNISHQVMSGEISKGSFVISNDKNRFMRGQVRSDCHFIEFEEENFQGPHAEINYIIRGDIMDVGESVSSEITVISNCGTKTFFIKANCQVPSCEVSSGKVKDLFHFANLAKEKPNEAVKLFCNEQFEEVFLYRDNKNIALYRGLIRGNEKRFAMEEFLIAIHKKLPLSISVNKTQFQYRNCKQNFADRFVLKKNEWGYAEYHLSVDNDFVKLYRDVITSYDFTGNELSVDFKVDYSKLRSGKNFARITVSGVEKDIDIDVIVTKAHEFNNKQESHKKHRKENYQFANLYLNFCMNKISSEEYFVLASDLISALSAEGLSLETQLYKVHFGIMEHKENTVKSGLAFLETQEAKMKIEQPLLYCAYLYFKGIWSGEDELAAKYSGIIKKYYEKNDLDWRYLWFLLYLSEDLESDEAKFVEIEKVLSRDCNSPIMYIELCSIINENIDFLREITPGVCKAIHWGSKWQYLTKEIALKYCYIAGKEKEFSKCILEDMCRFYQQFEDDEILAAICKMFMKGQVTNSKAFYWYELGIKHNLKLADLYEYYMYSVDESKEIDLQKSTLLYFIYDNHLSVGKKAMLYAYVVRNADKLGDIYESYRQIMEDFTLRQLAAGKINSNLAVLYEEFIREEIMNSKIASQLPSIMFANEIICNNPNIIGVYVMHRELQKEEFVPFVNGKAIISIFTDNHEIFLADKYDNRYSQSVNYTVNKLIHLDHLALKCFEKGSRDIKLIMYLYDQAERMNKSGKDVIDIKRQVVDYPGVSSYHYKKSFSSLVKYYFDNFESELLDTALENLDWSKVMPADRKEFIEYCTVRRFFDKAMEGVFLFGYDKIDGKRLLKMSSDIFASFEENENLLKLAWHIFETGNFDENMMKYLCRFYSGKITDMMKIWRYAKGFDFETVDFEERILGNIIFTEEMTPETYEVFYSYEQRGKDKILLLAFLKFVAYKYLVHNVIIPRKMFEYFYKTAKVQDNIFCLLTALKYLSTKTTLTDDEKQFADYNINNLYDKRMIFPFFREFYNKLSLPVHIFDQQYVSYTTNPDYEVRIHYLISSGYEKSEYVTETMSEVFMGIHVKEFVLFQDEMLQYYISEIRPEGEIITKSASVRFDETMDSERINSRYHTLNLMMIAMEMKDESTLIEMMKEYVEKNDCVSKLFRIKE